METNNVLKFLQDRVLYENKCNKLWSPSFLYIINHISFKIYHQFIIITKRYYFDVNYGLEPSSQMEIQFILNE